MKFPEVCEFFDSCHTNVVENILDIIKEKLETDWDFEINFFIQDYCTPKQCDWIKKYRIPIQNSIDEALKEQNWSSVCKITLPDEIDIEFKTILKPLDDFYNE